jgi:hypothetical protein
VRATRTYFKVEESIGLDEQLDDDIDKVVFILQKDVHYSLFAFGPDLEAQPNDPVIKPVTKTRRKRANDAALGKATRSSSRLAPKMKSSGSGGTRRRLHIKGGGNPNNVVVFHLNKMNSNPPSKKTNMADIFKIIPKDMIFDSGPTQIPNYMVMLIYSNYNIIRGSQGGHVRRTMMQNYIDYRLFYTEFFIIDALIESMATTNVVSDNSDSDNSDSDNTIDINSSEVLDKFIKKYDYVFAPVNLYTHQAYLPMVHQYKDTKQMNEAIEESKRGSHHGQLGGAPPVGRDASRFALTTEPVIATAVGPAPHMLNAMNPTAIAMDPTNVLSQHVMRIMNDDSSSLSFKVDVHLILAPGDEGIGVGDKVGYACESSRQDMSRSWSEITGNTYYPTARKE